MKHIVASFKHNTLFGFILGGIIFGCIGIYGANVYQSNTIEYSPTDESWSVSNVNEAINSLYSMKTELDNIKSIGDATAAQILSGKKAVVKGSTVTGTMTNRGAVTNALNAGGSYTIPAGYHNGSGKVTANSLASQTSATATAAQILSGQTAYVNGTKVTGTMANNGAVAKTLNAGGSYTIPAGYHNGSGKVTANSLASQTSATATAAQILTGKTAYVNGTKVTGTMANKGALTWKPSSSTTYTVPAGYYSGGTLDSSAAYTAGYNAGLAAGQTSATVVVKVYGTGGSESSVGNKTYTLTYPNTGNYSQGDGDTKVNISWQ